MRDLSVNLWANASVPIPLRRGASRPQAKRQRRSAAERSAALNMTCRHCRTQNVDEQSRFQYASPIHGSSSTRWTAESDLSCFSAKPLECTRARRSSCIKPPLSSVCMTWSVVHERLFEAYIHGTLGGPQRIKQLFRFSSAAASW